eukprot:TRINITY_DN481_c1_g1_i2.p1 TRINITY_DN481_c1_g1~~TRINITY_DN481_c1_g1_i2.p1  ORF type:complete len:288 (+),score=12.37 TRINITY_DN481_c1_g1_i2:30-893(+)
MQTTSENSAQETKTVYLKVSDAGKLRRIQVEWHVLVQKSNLFKQMNEECTIENDQEITLKLERPEIFMHLLDFILFGKYNDRIFRPECLTEYINDVIYLQINQLEEFFLSYLYATVSKLNGDRLVTFSQPVPNVDFMKHLLLERTQITEKEISLQLYNYQLFRLVADWAQVGNIDSEAVKQLVENCLDSSLLSVDNLVDLSNRYPQQFDQMFPSSSAILVNLYYKVKCKKCQKMIPRCAVNTDTCYVKQTYYQSRLVNDKKQKVCREYYEFKQTHEIEEKPVFVKQE